MKDLWDARSAANRIITEVLQYPDSKGLEFLKNCLHLSPQEFSFWKTQIEKNSGFNSIIESHITELTINVESPSNAYYLLENVYGTIIDRIIEHIKVVENALSSTDAFRRRNAAWIFSKISHRTNFPENKIRSLLNDEDIDVKKAALVALAGSSRLRKNEEPKIIEIFSDPESTHFRLISSEIHFLSSASSTISIPVIRNILKSTSLSPYNRSQWIELLSKHKPFENGVTVPDWIEMIRNEKSDDLKASYAKDIDFSSVDILPYFDEILEIFKNLDPRYHDNFGRVFLNTTKLPKEKEDLLWIYFHENRNKISTPPSSPFWLKLAQSKSQIISLLNSKDPRDRKLAIRFFFEKWESDEIIVQLKPEFEKLAKDPDPEIRLIMALKKMDSHFDNLNKKNEDSEEDEDIAPDTSKSVENSPKNKRENPTPFKADQLLQIISESAWISYESDSLWASLNWIAENSSDISERKKELLARWMIKNAPFITSEFYNQTKLLKFISESLQKMKSEIELEIQKIDAISPEVKIDTLVYFALLAKVKIPPTIKDRLSQGDFNSRNFLKIIRITEDENYAKTFLEQFLQLEKDSGIELTRMDANAIMSIAISVSPSLLRELIHALPHQDPKTQDRILQVLISGRANLTPFKDEIISLLKANNVRTRTLATQCLSLMGPLNRETLEICIKYKMEDRMLSATKNMIRIFGPRDSKLEINENDLKDLITPYLKSSHAQHRMIALDMLDDYLKDDPFTHDWGLILIRDPELMVRVKALRSLSKSSTKNRSLFDRVFESYITSLDASNLDQNFLGYILSNDKMTRWTIENLKNKSLDLLQVYIPQIVKILVASKSLQKIDRIPLKKRILKILQFFSELESRNPEKFPGLSEQIKYLRGIVDISSDGSSKIIIHILKSENLEEIRQYLSNNQIQIRKEAIKRIFTFIEDVPIEIMTEAIRKAIEDSRSNSLYGDQSDVFQYLRSRSYDSGYDLFLNELNAAMQSSDPKIKGNASAIWEHEYSDQKSPSVIEKFKKWRGPPKDGLNEAMQTETLCQIVAQSASLLSKVSPLDELQRISPSAWNFALQSLHFLFLVKSSPYCAQAQSMLSDYIKKNQLDDEVCIDNEKSDDQKNTESIFAFASGHIPQDRMSPSAPQLYGKQFYLLALQGLIDQNNIPKAFKNRAAAEIKKLRHSIEFDLKLVINDSSSVDQYMNSYFSTYSFVTATLSLPDKNRNAIKIMKGMKDAAQKKGDALRIPYSYFSERDSRRGASARAVPFYLALYLNDDDPKEKKSNLNILISALRNYGDHLPSLQARIFGNETHLGADGLAPYYFYSTIPYVTAALKILETTELPDTEKKELAALKAQITDGLFRLQKEDKLFQPQGGILYPKAEYYNNVLAGLALIPLLSKEQDYGIVRIPQDNRQ